MRKLTVDDILDLRAYERERDEIRAAIIALKRRRVALGELVTVVFENTETMRWQVMEMARRAHAARRADRARGRHVQRARSRRRASSRRRCSSSSDRTPSCASGSPSSSASSAASRWCWPTAPPSWVSPLDEERLTRDVTAAVHFLRFPLRRGSEPASSRGPVKLVVTHPEYSAETVLDADQHAELVADLAAPGAPGDS